MQSSDGEPEKPTSELKELMDKKMAEMHGVYAAKVFSTMESLRSKGILYDGESTEQRYSLRWRIYGAKVFSTLSKKGNIILN